MTDDKRGLQAFREIDVRWRKTGASRFGNECGRGPGAVSPHRCSPAARSGNYFNLKMISSGVNNPVKKGTNRFTL
jgi:hypothetical protein